MAEDFMIASECADFWDQALANYKEELEAYVMENPTYWGIGVATVKATGADLAHIFFVDVLRLGEGVASGGVKGFVQDFFRVLTFVPPGKVLQPFKGMKAVPLIAFGRVVQSISNYFRWSRVGGGLCAPITVAQAMQRTGQKLAVSLKGIADAIGTPLDELSKTGLFMSDLAGPLKTLGLEFDTLAKGSFSRLEDVFARAANADGPVMVAIKGWFKDSSGLLLEEGHAVLVSKTASGVKIIDRVGTFANFDALAARYGVVGKWAIETAEPLYIFKNAVVDDSLIKLVNQFGILACLARMSMGVFDFNRSKVTPEFVNKDFQRFVAERGGTRKKVLEGEEITIVGGKTVTVKAGDPNLSTLSGIAKSEYGDFNLWPLIYDLNKDKIGPNPNRLKPNTQLFLLPLDQYDAQEIAAAKRRAPTWKNYR